MQLSRRSLLVLLSSVPFAPAFAETTRVSAPKGGPAIRGYDTTAYFSASKATKGDAPNSVIWRGETWQFATAEDAALFEANPSSFAPQFGGFCTRAMSLKKVVHGDPEVWRIHKDKLYLFARPVGGEFFDKGEDAMIAKAQKHWDTLD